MSTTQKQAKAMGLDVYLYRYEDHAATSAAEDAASAFSEAEWKKAGGYDALSEEQKDAVRATVKAHHAALGLDEWGCDERRKTKIEIPSAKYPEHYFKIGYLRSSYNESGFNRIAQNACGMSLDDVFNPGDEYDFAPDWEKARVAAVALLEKLQNAPKLRVSTIDATSPFGPPSTYDAADAIRLTVAERARKHSDDFGAYSNRDGHFFVKPFAILAAIPGKSYFGPALHLVYEDEGFDWYVQAAEIVVEMIDYVLAQPDREKYRLHWSS